MTNIRQDKNTSVVDNYSHYHTHTHTHTHSDADTNTHTHTHSTTSTHLTGVKYLPVFVILHVTRVMLQVLWKAIITGYLEIGEDFLTSFLK